MTATEADVRLRAKAAAADLIARHYVAYVGGSNGHGPKSLAAMPDVGDRLALTMLTTAGDRLVAAGPAAERLVAALVEHLTAEPTEVGRG